MTNGKGDKRRPGDRKAFDSGWDRIFGPQPLLCKECRCEMDVFDGPAYAICSDRLCKLYRQVVLL